MTTTASRAHANANPQIGTRLLEARKRAGLSQRQVVADLPYSAAYLCSIEAGKRTPSLMFLRAVAVPLAVSPAWLETGKDLVDVRIPRALAERFVDAESLDISVEIELHDAIASALGREQEPWIGVA